MSYSFTEYNGLHLVTPEPTGEPAQKFNINFSGVADHLVNVSNPHSVNYYQAGADPSGAADAIQTYLTEHSGNLSNPHGVTASQIGTYTSGEIVSGYQSKTSRLRDITFMLGGDLTIENDPTNHILLVESGYFRTASAIVSVAPSGGDIVFGLQKNAVDIQSDKLTIRDLATSATSTSFSVPTFSQNDYLSINNEHVGSGIAGNTASVVLTVEYIT